MPFYPRASQLTRLDGVQNYEAFLEVHKRKGRDLLYFFSGAQPVSLSNEVFQVCYDIYDS